MSVLADIVVWGGVMPYRVPAVQSAISILRYLQERQNRRCTLSEIARDLSLNKSTCHSVLKTLEGEGFVRCDELTRSYRLGPALISLGASAARHADYLAVALPIVRKLVQEITFVCLISQLLPDGQIVVVDKAESLKDIKVTAAVGERFPITAAALGKSFLAWLPPADAEAIVRRAGLPRFTPNSVTDLQALIRELHRVRELGYSVSLGEYYLHTNAVASPVFGPDGRVMLVLCVMGLSSDLTDELVPLYGIKLKETASAITAAIGGAFPVDFPRSRRETVAPVAHGSS